MKTRFMFVLTLLTLPLLGWGCTGDQSRPSVSEKSDTAATVNDGAVPAEENPAKPAAKDDDQPAPTAQSALPEGWKVYEGEKYKVKFGYPANWHIAENLGVDGFYVFLADKEIPLTPEPMTPITVQLTSDTLQQTRAELLRQDPNLVIDTVQVNGKKVDRIRYQSEVFGKTEYVYGLSGALLWHIDDPAVQQIAMQILSTYTQGDAP